MPPVNDPGPLHFHTPLRPFRPPQKLQRSILLKLDNVQPSGSFKIRGLGHLCQVAWGNGARHFIGSSGGNAGAALAYAGEQLGAKVTVVVPSTTPEFMRSRIKQHRAEVIIHGAVWDEADAYARKLVAESTEHAEYISPFDDVRIWEGCSSVVRELVDDLRGTKPAGVIVSVGGGGLFLGVARGLEKVGWSDVPIIAVETEGTASFKAMVNNKGHPVKIDAIKGLAKSLGALMVSEECGKWIQKPRPVISTLVSDREAVEACAILSVSERILVEPACGASVAAALDEALLSQLPAGPVIVIVCGGNMASPKLLSEWVDSTGAQVPDLY